MLCFSKIENKGKGAKRFVNDNKMKALIVFIKHLLMKMLVDTKRAPFGTDTICSLHWFTLSFYIVDNTNLLRY